MYEADIQCSDEDDQVTYKSRNQVTPGDRAGRKKHAFDDRGDSCYEGEDVDMEEAVEEVKEPNGYVKSEPRDNGDSDVIAADAEYMPPSVVYNNRIFADDNEGHLTGEHNVGQGSIENNTSEIGGVYTQVRGNPVNVFMDTQDTSVYQEDPRQMYALLTQQQQQQLQQQQQQLQLQQLQQQQQQQKQGNQQQQLLYNHQQQQYMQQQEQIQYDHHQQQQYLLQRQQQLMIEEQDKLRYQEEQERMHHQEHQLLQQQEQRLLQKKQDEMEINRFRSQNNRNVNSEFKEVENIQRDVPRQIFEKEEHSIPNEQIQQYNAQQELQKRQHYQFDQQQQIAQHQQLLQQRQLNEIQSHGKCEHEFEVTTAQTMGSENQIERGEQLKDTNILNVHTGANEVDEYVEYMDQDNDLATRQMQEQEYRDNLFMDQYVVDENTGQQYILENAKPLLPNEELIQSMDNVEIIHNNVSVAHANDRTLLGHNETMFDEDALVADSKYTIVNHVSGEEINESVFNDTNVNESMLSEHLGYDNYIAGPSHTDLVPTSRSHSKISLSISQTTFNNTQGNDLYESHEQINQHQEHILPGKTYNEDNQTLNDYRKIESNTSISKSIYNKKHNRYLRSATPIPKYNIDDDQISTQSILSTDF